MPEQTQKEKRCDLAYEVFSLAVENTDVSINFTRMHDMLAGEFDEKLPDAKEFIST